MNRRSFLSVAAAGCAALAPRIGSAATINQVRFEDRIHADDRLLDLRGTGMFYYRSLIKVAAAGLYLDEGAVAADVLNDVAKRLEMHYFRGVRGRDLFKGGAALLRRNVPPDRLAAIQPQLDKMRALYQDVRSGDRVGLTYVPEAGTTVSLNGEPLGTVPGADFAAAYFSIWFGEKPLDPGLKRRLLGG